MKDGLPFGMKCGDLFPAGGHRTHKPKPKSALSSFSGTQVVKPKRIQIETSGTISTTVEGAGCR
jgi:hypothetical protein